MKANAARSRVVVLLAAMAASLPTLVARAQPAAEDAAISAALELCRQGQRAQAVDRLSAALQVLPLGHRVADVLARLALQEKLETHILDDMETWTIPPDSPEVGLPSAWLSLRGRLLRGQQSELAQELLVQAVGKARALVPGADEALARLVDAGEQDQVTQKLRDLGATPSNLALFAVLLAEGRANPDLALNLLAPVIRAEPEDAWVRMLRVRLLRRLNRGAEAVEAADEAMLKVKRENDPLRLAQVALLDGDALAAVGRAEEAKRAYALAEDAATQACDPGLAARAQVARGQALLDSGEILEAERLFRAALAVQKDNADARAALARLLDLGAEPESALEHFAAAAPALQAQDRGRDVALLHADWAGALANLGRMDEALNHERLALEAAGTLGDRALACRFLIRTSRIWTSLRDAPRAKMLLDAAAKLAGAEGSPALRAVVDCALADETLSGGALQDALTAARRCEDGADRTRDAGLGVQARTLAARALNELGQSSAAEHELGSIDEANPSVGAAIGPDQRAEWLLELARAQAGIVGRESTAAATWASADAAAASLGRSDLRWKLELERARADRAAGREGEAIEALKRSVAIVEETRADINPPGRLADRSAARLEPYAELIELLLPRAGAAERPPDRKESKKPSAPAPAANDQERRRLAWEIADRRTGRRLRDQLVRPADAASTAVERRLVDRDTELSRELVWVHAAQASPVFDRRLTLRLERWFERAGLPPARTVGLRAAAAGKTDPRDLKAFLHDTEVALASDQSSVQAELAGTNPRLASVLWPQPAALPAVQAALTPDEALVLYVLRKEGTLALVATAERFHWSRLNPWSDLAPRAAAFVQQLARAPRPGQAFRPQDGAVLFQTLIQAPLTEAGLPDLPARLDVIGDGPVLDLPFPALPLPGGGFLVEKTMTSLLPAGWWRLEESSPPPNGGSAVLFGSPFLPAYEAPTAFQIGDVTIAGDWLRLEPEAVGGAPKMPSSSAVEVQTIADALGGEARSMVEGSAAEAEATSATLGGAWLIHFAAPSVGDARMPQNAGVWLAQREGGSEDGVLGSRGNPSAPSRRQAGHPVRQCARVARRRSGPGLRVHDCGGAFGRRDAVAARGRRERVSHGPDGPGPEEAGTGRCTSRSAALPVVGSGPGSPGPHAEAPGSSAFLGRVRAGRPAVAPRSAGALTGPAWPRSPVPPRIDSGAGAEPVEGGAPSLSKGVLRLSKGRPRSWGYRHGGGRGATAFRGKGMSARDRPPAEAPGPASPRPEE